MRTVEVGRAPLSRRSFCEGGRASARTVPPQWDALPHYHGLMFVHQEEAREALVIAGYGLIVQADKKSVF